MRRVGFWCLLRLLLPHSRVRRARTRTGGCRARWRTPTRRVGFCAYTGSALLICTDCACFACAQPCEDNSTDRVPPLTADVRATVVRSQAWRGRGCPGARIAVVSCWKLNRRAPRARVARRASAWSSCKAVLRLIQWWVLEKMIITCAGGVAGFSVEQVEECAWSCACCPSSSPPSSSGPSTPRRVPKSQNIDSSHAPLYPYNPQSSHEAIYAPKHDFPHACHLSSVL